MPQTNNFSRFDVYPTDTLTPTDMRFAVAGRARSGRPKPTIVMDLVTTLLCLELWIPQTNNLMSICDFVLTNPNTN